LDITVSKSGVEPNKVIETKIQRFQNKVLWNIVNATWYIRNNDLYRDLEMDAVSSEIQRFAQKHEGRLHHHENVEAIELLDNMGIVRRLQRKKNPLS
jgi:hypothetical protein